MISCSNIAVYRVEKTMKTSKKQTPPSPLGGVADAQGGLKKIPAKSGKPASSGKTEVVAIEDLDSEIASMLEHCPVVVSVSGELSVGSIRVVEEAVRSTGLTKVYLDTRDSECWWWLDEMESRWQCVSDFEREGGVDAIVLVESRLTPMGEKIRDLQAELLELFDRKNRDYGTGNIATFGELGVLVRCSDKVARLKNMLGSGGEPNFESLEDSWRDLAVHAMIGLLCHRGEWK